MYSLIPLIYNPADKQGAQLKAAVALTLGDFVYTSGSSAVNGIEYQLVRKATTGMVQLTGAGANVANRFGVVFREPQAYRSDDEVDDTTWNTIGISDTVIVFYGGTFRTSRFDSSINAGNPGPGSPLWVNIDGLLSDGTGAGQQANGDRPVAQLIAYREAGTTDFIDYRIL